MNLSGAKKRRWIQSPDEQLQMIKSLIVKMKSSVDINWNQKGLLISASVDKTFSEPGDSYFFANIMGLENVECLDILDACNSHVRAWFIAQSLLKSKSYDWILIVSAECRSGFELYNGKNKERFSFHNKNELTWRFPSLTLGDAIAVSLLKNDDNATEWPFEIISQTTNAPLCYAHTQGARMFQETLQTFNEQNNLVYPSEFKTNRNEMQFPCFYSQLELASLKPVVKVWENLRARLQLKSPGLTEKLISHSSNFNGWSSAAQWAGFSAEKHMNVYENYGNIVSCSVPASLATAHSQGQLQTGDKINVWTGAAGSSFFAFQFPFTQWKN